MIVMIAPMTSRLICTGRPKRRTGRPGRKVGGSMARKYDGLYIFVGAAKDETLDKMVEKMRGEITRLSGTILEGITRDSLVHLLDDDGHKVIERDISLAEVREGIADGQIAEVFACGTAAVVTPVGRLKGATFDLTVGDGSAGGVTMEARKRLMDIQYGRVEDTYGWMRRVR